MALDLRAELEKLRLERESVERHYRMVNEAIQELETEELRVRFIEMANSITLEELHWTRFGSEVHNLVDFWEYRNKGD